MNLIRYRIYVTIGISVSYVCDGIFKYLSMSILVPTYVLLYVYLNIQKINVQ